MNKEIQNLITKYGFKCEEIQFINPVTPHKITILPIHYGVNNNTGESFDVDTLEELENLLQTFDKKEVYKIDFKINL